jgi:hypothetical protein
MRAFHRYSPRFRPRLPADLLLDLLRTDERGDAVASTASVSPMCLFTLELLVTLADNKVIEHDDYDENRAMSLLPAQGETTTAITRAIAQWHRVRRFIRSKLTWNRLYRTTSYLKSALWKLRSSRSSC